MSLGVFGGGVLKIAQLFLGFNNFPYLDTMNPNPFLNTQKHAFFKVKANIKFLVFVKTQLQFFQMHFGSLKTLRSSINNFINTPRYS